MGKKDLSSFVTVTDFGGLNDITNIQPKSYPVTLTVKSVDSGLPTDISTIINVTVVDVDAVLKVEFVNESNQVLPGYTVTINTQVEDTVNLTQKMRLNSKWKMLQRQGMKSLNVQ